MSVDKLALCARIDQRNVGEHFGHESLRPHRLEELRCLLGKLALCASILYGRTHFASSATCASGGTSRETKLTQVSCLTLIGMAAISPHAAPVMRPTNVRSSAQSPQASARNETVPPPKAWLADACELRDVGESTMLTSKSLGCPRHASCSGLFRARR